MGKKWEIVDEVSYLKLIKGRKRYFSEKKRNKN